MLSFDYAPLPVYVEIEDKAPYLAPPSPAIYQQSNRNMTNTNDSTTDSTSDSTSDSTLTSNNIDDISINFAQWSSNFSNLSNSLPNLINGLNSTVFQTYRYIKLNSEKFQNNDPVNILVEVYAIGHNQNIKKWSGGAFIVFFLMAFLFRIFAGTWLSFSYYFLTFNGKPQFIVGSVSVITLLFEQLYYHCIVKPELLHYVIGQLAANHD